VNKYNNSKPVSGEDALPDAERRRIGRVVHDERGNASVKWRDAPLNHERPVLEVLGDGGLTLKAEETFDPYARRQARELPKRARPPSAAGRTDLRKLSEHIKMMRELEERKRGDGGDEE
jgi:hypothetical protein